MQDGGASQQQPQLPNKSHDRRRLVAPLPKTPAPGPAAVGTDRLSALPKELQLQIYGALQGSAAPGQSSAQRAFTQASATIYRAFAGVPEASAQQLETAELLVLAATSTDAFINNLDALIAHQTSLRAAGVPVGLPMHSEQDAQRLLPAVGRLMAAGIERFAVDSLAATRRLRAAYPNAFVCRTITPADVAEGRIAGDIDASLLPSVRTLCANFDAQVLDTLPYKEKLRWTERNPKLTAQQKDLLAQVEAELNSYGTYLGHEADSLLLQTPSHNWHPYYRDRGDFPWLDVAVRTLTTPIAERKGVLAYLQPCTGFRTYFLAPSVRHVVLQADPAQLHTPPEGNTTLQHMQVDTAQLRGLLPLDLTGWRAVTKLTLPVQLSNAKRTQWDTPEMLDEVAMPPALQTLTLQLREKSDPAALSRIKLPAGVTTLDVVTNAMGRARADIVHHLQRLVRRSPKLTATLNGLSLEDGAKQSRRDKLAETILDPIRRKLAPPH